MKNINENIKIDLHIHSKISGYKTGDKELVSNSTFENIDVLFSKLEENKISLISITDHNRFDSSLYKKIKNKIASEKLKYPSNIIAGIEFDVQFDKIIYDGKEAKGQINVYFDAKEESDFDRIENILNENLLEKESEFYKKEKFEEILKKIGLNTILITSQTQGLKTKTKGKTSSLTEHCKEPIKYFKIGYIDAIEYSKPSIEGIILNSFFILEEESVAMISFSDCHEWTAYPFHDKLEEVKKSNIDNKNKYFTEIKSLPTFKGLLLSLSSIETRIGRETFSKNNFLEKINLNNKEINFDKSVNVIIGNNGAGKTFFLEQIFQNKPNSKYNFFKEKNLISFVNKDEQNKLKEPKIYIKQNQILENFNKNKLFLKKFQNNNSTFEEELENFSNLILKIIDKNIEINKLEKEMKNQKFIFYENNQPYNIHLNDDLVSQTNPYSDIKTKLNSILKNMNELKKEKLFHEKDNSSFSKIKKTITAWIKKYDKLFEYWITKNEIISIIKKHISDFKAIRSSEEKENNSFKLNNNLISSNLKNYIKNKKEFSDCLIKLDSFSFSKHDNEKIPDNGFVFVNEVEYSNLTDKEIKDSFYRKVFKNEIKNSSDLSKIKNENLFCEKIKGGTKDSSTDSAKSNFFSNIDILKKDLLKNTTYITSTTYDNISSKEKTPGEQSLIFLKYQLTRDLNTFVIIDQPEDNISNKNIALELIKEINKKRDKEQFFIVTHNPLLAIDLDADNIIFLKNENNEIAVQSGCLEYENDDYSILNIVLENLEGGETSLKKRIKMYGYEKNKNRHQ